MPPLAIVAIVSRPVSGVLALTEHKFAVGAIVFLLAGCCYMALLQFPAVSSPIERISLSLQRRIMTSCQAIREAGRGSLGLCRFVAAEFKRPRLTHPKQRDIIQSILELVKNRGEHPRLFAFLIGPSGSGKTRASLLLVESLVRSREYARLAERTLYYDLASSPSVSDTLASRLGSHQHRDSLVIIDNFHLAGSKMVARVTGHLLDTAGESSEQMILLLARPIPEWRGSAGVDVRLLNHARDRGVLYNLYAPSDSKLESQLSAGSSWNDISQIANANRATISKIVLAEMAATEGTRSRKSEFVRSIMLGGDPTIRAPGDLDTCLLLAAITGLAFERGTFTRREFNLASRAIHSGFGFSTLRARWTMSSGLRRLSKDGFVQRMSMSERRYVFHEGIAETVREHLRSHDEFERAFRLVVQWRLGQPHAAHDVVFRWIGGCEIGQEDVLVDSFDAAMLAGGTNAMLRSLRRNESIVRQSSAVHLQYCILLDRAGEFEHARVQLRSLAQSGAADPIIVNRARLALIESEHGQRGLTIVKEIEQSEDTINKIASRYWRRHMSAHRGAFSSVELIHLAEQLQVNFSPEQVASSFSLSYLASRIFFDAARHAYLRYDSILETLDSLEKLDISTVLRAAYPQYSAAHRLYFRAHLLAHFHLPRLAILALQPPADVASEITDVSAQGPLGIEQLTTECLNQYRSAQREYEVYGDREHLYLMADVLNCRMQLAAVDELGDITPAIAEYEQFIRKSRFFELASYPHLYWFRWHMLARSRSLAAGYMPYEDPEFHLREARRHISVAYTRDRAAANRYGVRRAMFLESLCRLPDGGPQAIARLESVIRHAQRHWDGPFAAFGSHLLRDGKPYIHEVDRVILFFPIIHQ